MARIDRCSELADRTSQSAVRRRRHRHLSAAAIGNVRAWRARLRRERLHLLSQPASARRLRGGRHRAKMGKSSQRAARLHFRAAGVSWENADGPGHREHRRARARGTGELSSSRCCRSCSFAKWRNKPRHLSLATRSGGFQFAVPGFQLARTKSTSSDSEGPSLFAVSFSNSKRKSGRSTNAGGRSAMASSNRG